MGQEKYRLDFLKSDSGSLKRSLFDFWDKTLKNMLSREMDKAHKENSGLLYDKRNLYEELRKECAFYLFTRNELLNKPFLMDFVLEKGNSGVFLKTKNTFDGSGVAKVFLNPLDPKGLLTYMKRHRYEYLELPVQQKKELSAIAPKGISTLNVLTLFTDEDNPKILNASQQFTSFKDLDSMGAGGIWLNLDPDHGNSLGNGVQIFPQRKFLDRHPLSDYHFKNFCINEWDDVYTFLVDLQLRLNLLGLISVELLITETDVKLMGFSKKDILSYWLRFGDPLMLKIKLNS